jgi:dynein intermediate chain, cytosolic
VQFGSPSYDYVCDAQWSPAHPAVFSTITSGGELSLWNLVKSTSEPVETLKIMRDLDESGSSSVQTLGKGPASAATHATTTEAALNKSVWCKDGRSLLVGDAKGSVHLVSVQEGAVKFSASEESRLEMSLLSNKSTASSSS